MKKVLSLFLVLIIAFSLAACGEQTDTSKETPNVETTNPVDGNPDTTEKETGTEVDNSEPETPSLPEDGEFHAFVVNVGYVDSAKLDKYIHPSSMQSNGDINYPVFIIRSLMDLQLFTDYYDDTLNLGSADDNGTFKGLTSVYNNEFFETNSLMIAYIASSSGSIAYRVDSMELNNQHLNMNIVAEIPEVGTTDMAGFFAVARLYNDIIEDCDTFTASRVIEDD